MLSLKLAVNNFRKGFKSFAPFLMASITMFVMLFVTAAIGFSPSIKSLRGAESVSLFMKFALVVLAVFTIVILIYSYRFLQLQRSKEFGLYDILGLGKAKIISVSFLELLINYVCTIVVGIIVGISLSKFLFLIFTNFIGENSFSLVINLDVIGLVSLIYMIFYILLMIIGSFIIWKSSSLDLLREASKGEKEPKSNVLLALLSVILLSIGYFLAITVDNPVTALTRFFIAVLLVIFGTYLFYISFTVWYLNYKKKRPSYYKPNNFITTSSMLYRIKANAAGLANITILLSMTIVTIIVSLGIFFGTEKMVMDIMPKEAMITVQNNESKGSLEAITTSLASKSNTNIKNVSNLYIAQNIAVSLANNTQGLLNTTVENSTNDDFYLVTLTTRDSLISSGSVDLPPLEDNQIFIKDESFKSKFANGNLHSLNWFNTKYTISKQVNQLSNFPTETSFENSLILVFANNKELDRALSLYNKQSQNKEFSSEATSLMLFDINKKDEKSFNKAFNETAPKDATLAFRSEALADQRAQVGGFVFIGFVLGISFILGAALIIYYKQLSEGTQDKRSFKILQEVGLSKEEVQKTIQSQTRMIFFLPLLITALHFAGAYRMIASILNIFGANDSKLVFIISTLTLLGCAVIYYIIYKITSRVYYKIVER